MIKHNVSIPCEQVQVATVHSTNDLEVELMGINSEDIADIAFEVCDADYLAGRMVLEHLDEVKEALKELENE